MRTVYNQEKPRHERVSDSNYSILGAMHQTMKDWDSLTDKKLAPLTNLEALEVVKFDFHISDRDIHDEEMGAIVDCLDRIAEGLSV